MAITKIGEISPVNDGVRTLVLETETSEESGNTLTLDLNEYGTPTLLGVTGFVHSTENSVVANEQPTTSVTEGVLTLTVGGSSVTAKRVYVVYLR